jgi:DNA-binding CsgD family transcriptional regulator
LNAIGFLTFLQGDYDTSQPLLEKSVELWRKLDDRRGLLEALTNLGVLLRCVGSGARARSCFEESITLSQALGERAWEGRTLNKLARLTFYEGDLAGARALHEAGLVAVRQDGNAWDVAIALGDLADVYYTSGEHTAAWRHYAESLGLWQELGDERGIAQVLEGFAILASAESRWARAVSLIGTARAIRERIAEPNSPNRLAALESLLGSARTHLGDAFEAIWTAGSAATPAQAIAETLRKERAPARDRALPAGEEALSPARSEPAATTAGAASLSTRELDVVALIARGEANSDIADALIVSRRTVEWHVGNILRKLGLQSRAQLIAWARDHSVTPPD